MLKMGRRIYIQTLKSLHVFFPLRFYFGDFKGNESGGDQARENRVEFGGGGGGGGSGGRAERGRERERERGGGGGQKSACSSLLLRHLE